MAEIKILSNNPISTYATPDKKIPQRVITYQYGDLAPRTLWLDSEKLPDEKWKIDNPDKPVPANIQAQGDAYLKKAIEADVAKRAQAGGGRSI